MFSSAPVYIISLINDGHELPATGSDQESHNVELALGSVSIPRNRPFILVAKLGFEVDEPASREGEMFKLIICHQRQIRP